MAERFKDKTVLVTGSAGGLGRGFALGFAREGADLILVDVNEAGMEESAAGIRALGRKASIHRVDLSVEADIQALGEAVTREYPKLDVLINNAGLAYGEIAFSFETLSQAKWLHFLSVNTVAPLLLATALKSSLVTAKGSIINQSSMASYMPGTAYGVTKAALNAMTYGMARLFGQDGVRVNAIAPGIMETPNNRLGIPPAHYEQIQSQQILKLHGTADDIVNLGLFLASDDARFITCEIVHCDAGHPFRGWRG